MQRPCQSRQHFKPAAGKNFFGCWLSTVLLNLTLVWLIVKLNFRLLFPEIPSFSGFLFKNWLSLLFSCAMQDLLSRVLSWLIWAIAEVPEKAIAPTIANPKALTEHKKLLILSIAPFHKRDSY